MKSTDLSSLNVQGPVYINDSLCSYYKCLWSKCKSLHDGNFIHSFWVTNGSIRNKVNESSQTQEVSHICDLEEPFPGNHCLADMSNQEWIPCLPFYWVKYDILCWARYDILCLVFYFLFFELLQNLFEYFENWTTPFSINWVILTKIASLLVCMIVTMTTFLTWDLIGSIFEHN